MANPIFTQLKEKLSEVKNLEQISSLLHWDMEVLMPPKGAEARGDQLATLAALQHRLFTRPEIGELLQQLSEDTSLTQDEQLMVSESHYDYQRATCLPESFVREFSETRTKSYHAWTEARKKNDFSIFEPHLSENVRLSRQAAEHYGYTDSPYDALLESYERGMTSAQIKSIFGPLGTELKKLVTEIGEQVPNYDDSWSVGDFSKEAQKNFTEKVLADLGYDFDAGRLDLAPHPFCTNFDLYDVRITSRFEPSLFGLLYSSIHETGHALYEQGFDPAWRGTVLADAPSLGIHECNSRLWENMIARSLPFWKCYTPVLKKHFPNQFDEKSVEDFHRATMQVSPSLIRVESDEVTYNLHIIIRFELESAMIEGDLAVKDLPAAWKEKYRDYLGIDVPSDAQGCLQDIHWSEAIFGYFPTYALGNLYAAQVMNRIRTDIPNLDQQIEQGQFIELREWLRKHIHHVGRRQQAAPLIASLTGKTISADDMMTYLRAKYLG